MWRHDDQAATLRRWFRREPPAMHSLYAAGRDWARMTERFMTRLVTVSGRALLADEATGSVTLPEARGVGRPADLLLVLQTQSPRQRFDLTLRQGWGYLNLKAAAVALPLLDETQRERLFAAFEHHARRYDVVVLFGGGASVADASWWLTSTPRHWLLAEVSGSGRRSNGRANSSIWGSIASRSLPTAPICAKRPGSLPTCSARSCAKPRYPFGKPRH